MRGRANMAQTEIPLGNEVGRKHDPDDAYECDTSTALARRSAEGGGQMRCQFNRRPECVERWPECESGAYDPRCCRFPKSCSCNLTPEEEAAAYGDMVDREGPSFG